MPVEPLPCEPGPPGPGPGPGPDPCCSPSITTASLCLDDGTPIAVVLRSACACDDAEPGDPEVAGWLDPATGTYTPGAPPAGAGPCPAGDDTACASVVLLPLCDHTPDGECVPFLRHLVHDCDGQVTATTDTTPDGVTPYTPTGDVIDCDDCPCDDGTKSIPLCDYQDDGTSVPFLRHLTYSCTTGAVTEQTDTETDGATPYTPTGEVGECGECRPTPMCPGFAGLSGPDTWTIPPGTESVHVSVACGPVVVYPCSGDVDGVVVNECGVSLTWSAPGGDCQPGVLCEEFRIEIPEGGAAYISWLTAGCGDES